MTNATSRAIAAPADTAVNARSRMMLTWSGLALAGITALGFVGQAKAQEVTVSHGYSSFGELKYGPDIKHLDYVNPDAPKGGEISTWALGTFDSFNQYARDGNPAALNTIGSERILTSTADDPYGMYCYLCETLEYDEDLTYVQFNLRQDVKFWDGTQLTAHDLKFTNELFRTKGIPEYRRIVENFFENVEVIDDFTIKFTFNPESSKRDRVSIAGITPSFSKKWFEDTEAQLDKATDAPFMSTGPYVLDSFDYNRQVIYRRNEDFWGKDHPFSVGHYNFDTIRTEYFADRTAAFEAFKTGAYLFKAESDPKDWATGYNFENVQNGAVKLDTPVDGTVGQALSFVFNLDRAPWQDLKVREAVSLAFNFEWSNKALFYDLFERPDSFWPNTDLAATGVPTEGELAILQPLVDEGLLPASILTDTVTTQTVQDADKNRPSRGVLRRASKLLDEAGWEFGDGQFREKDGETLKLNIIQFNPLYDRVVNPYIENLVALGIDADLERIDRAQYIERRRAGDFDMTNQGFQMPFEPSLGMEQWFSSKTADNSSRNLMRLRDPAVDAIIPAIVDATSLEDLKTAVRAFDRVLLSLRFAIPQWYKKENWLAYYDVYRRPENLPPLAIGLYDFWWYDQEAEDRLKASGVLR